MLQTLTSRLSFDLPLDQHQRELAARALARAGAPFDPGDPEAFRAGVRRTWEHYQAARGGPAPGRWPGGLALLASADRLLYQRQREEYIDDVTLPDERRTRLIGSLDRLNRLTFAYHFLQSALLGHLRGTPPGEVTLLDLGSGHGSVPIRLAARPALGAHRLRVVGSDLAPAYVARARQRARQAGVAVEFRELDALRLDRLEEPFDVITCTQTVHHFPPEFLAELMVQARRVARRGVLFFDARRAALNLAAVALLSPLVNRDPYFRHDGVVSVRRMYSPAELELLARCAPGGDIYRARNFGLSYVVLEARTLQPEAPL